MANIIDTVITIIIGTITGISQAVTTTVSTLRDFFYVKIGGASFIVLGARQTGKTTLIHWLRHNAASLSKGFDPEPTAAGGERVPDFAAKVGDSYIKLKPNRDVGGEYAMWETDWVDLFRAAQPHGIIFMLDHGDVHLQKDALNFVMQMIEDEPAAAKQLRAVYLLVNKADLWGGEMTLKDIMAHYRNEEKRLKGQAERVGYQIYVAEGSLYAGQGVSEFMSQFLNALRPKPRQAE